MTNANKLEERKLKEIEHSDRRRSIVRAHEYKTDATSDEMVDKYVEGEKDFEQHFSNMKFYSISRASFAHRDALLYSKVKGAVALDYCCGNGEIAVEMAKRGAAKVYGIDISTVAIENAQNLARDAGVDKVCFFKVMDAEHTVFSDQTFDIIHEYGALHHLELSAAFKELARILKPGGSVVCTEALRHNPFIHWYRQRTPQLRTEWEVEHILGFPEIKKGKEFFSEMSLRTFHLAALAAVPFRKIFFFEPLLGLLNILDRVLLSIPLLDRMAWVSVIEYRRPMK